MTKINDDITIHFPLDLKPRDQQIEALDFCKKSINNGKKNILLNMPTGSGKSYLIVMLANFYKCFVNSEAKFDILTNSKILQDQYIRDFPFMKNLKGMSNYYCNFHKTDCGEGKEINRILKRICDNCPYDAAKFKWVSSDISTSNFALFISMALYTDTLQRRGSNVLIIDESHDFESVFCDFISTKLNKNLLKKCGFNQSAQYGYNRLFKQVKTPDEFIQFIEEGFVPDLQKLHDNHMKRIGGESEKTIKASYRKQMVYTGKLMERLETLMITYHKNKDNWSLDITYKDKEIELNLQPIWGYPYLRSILWKNYDHIIFMSGTLLDKNMFAYINGLEPELTTYKEMDSTFDVSKRPLYYMKAGKMTYKEKVNTFNEQVKLVEKILRKYKDKKGIIHTFNYEIADWIKERIKDKRLIFHTSDNRDEMYEKFINSKKPSVMVSPSMMSGVDLKDELSRFAIILKIPYPNISSNKIKDRQKSNRNWYDWKTIVDIIQTYGRTIRSDEDYADTFILDSSLSDIMKYKSRYLPRYFTNAIKTLK